MLRKLVLLAAFAVVGSVALAADEDKKPAAGKFGGLDKAKMFEKMDGDGDGKVTKEEFKKFRETLTEKIKDKAGGAAGMLDTIFDKMFEKMDADGDGKVTKEEFEKFQPAGAFGGLDAEKLQKLKDRFKKN